MSEREVKERAGYQPDCPLCIDVWKVLDVAALPMINAVVSCIPLEIEIDAEKLRQHTLSSILGWAVALAATEGFCIAAIVENVRHNADKQGIIEVHDHSGRAH